MDTKVVPASHLHCEVLSVQKALNPSRSRFPLLSLDANMPNISIIRSHLFEAVGKEFTDEQFDELCFEFGVEIDDICTEVLLFFSCTIILIYLCF